jgi:hypothetical protein
MNKDFLEQQKALVLQRLEALGDADAQGKRELTIVSEYLSSLLHPENYPEADKEDLRKLALELDYKDDTDFAVWETTPRVVEAPKP